MLLQPVIVDGLLFAAEFRETWLPLWALELIAKVLLGAWLFYFGACVGSFLNVVVYRLPRGMNLIYPGSHCPHCGHSIRLHDNVPLFGWLLLGGRCRDCRTPISSRYFVIEFVVAMTFLNVAVFEAFVQRHSSAPPGTFSGRPLVTPHAAFPFWCAYATHVLLLTTLIGAALIDWDGFRTPRSLFLPILAVGLLLPLLWPEIRRLPALPARSDEPAWQAGLIDGAAGLAVGTLVGLLSAGCWWLGSRGRGWPKFAPVLLCASLGAVLGWQRTVLMPGAALLWVLGIFAVRLSRLPIVVPYAGLAMLCGAPWLVEIDSDAHQAALLGEPDRRGLVAAIVGPTATLWLIAGAIAPVQYFVSRGSPPAGAPPSAAGDAEPLPDYREDDPATTPTEPPADPAP
jgi:leader peptidase (prepilin peptidase)/N-methyltransferase